MSNEMWGGRFDTAPSAIMEEINASIGFDQKLYAQDIRGSKAHAQMLGEQGIISLADVKALHAGLDQIKIEIETGKFAFLRSREDIHMNIEARLFELVGEPARRLHTARSRNDQVATDVRLWVRDTLDHLDVQMRDFQQALAQKAADHAQTFMPGFTHLQTAQPTTLGHHLLAYVEMIARDRSRLRDARVRLNECPLGSAALCGTSFPINRRSTATALGFDRPTQNSLDGVSDRDFAIESLAMAAICAMHLSRLAEEIIIWITPFFNFISLSDAFSTGSSIMPQKKNPDAAELVRAKTGRINGALITMLTLMKGLPLTYAKDMQEDKEPLFDALPTLSLALAAMTGMVRDMTPNTAAMRKAAGAGYATATDLADWLVRTLNLPFREAHHVTGRLVRVASDRKIALDKLPLSELQKEHAGITQEVYGVLSVARSVASRVSEGGTAPKNVKAQARKWLKQLEKEMKPASI